MHSIVKAAAILGSLLSATSWAGSQSMCAGRQTPQQIDARIDELIAKMTVAERISQLGDRAPAIQHLGIAAYNWWNEGLHGIARNGYATVFPQAIGLAATWDTELLRAVGDTVSTEARAKFADHAHADSARFAGLTIWSPNINIFRDPRWGRGQETYGEDPFLTASLGTEFVRGVQGDDPFYRKADATPKHFAAHSGPEEGRDSFNAKVTPHDLADTYLPAFRALTTTARAAALMCSYNAIDGVPSCANTLLEKTLRDSWGFKGYVVSDCDAVGNISSYHHYTADAAHGAADALNAGVDLDCGNSYEALAPALQQHLTTEAAVNRSLHRLLLAKMRLGMFDEPACSAYGGITAAENDTTAHRALALRAAEESIVLLKNDGTLPLKATQHLAVIGENADSIKALEANYHGTASHPVTPLDGLTQAFAEVSYAQGSLLAAGVPAIVPRTALATGADDDAEPGLTAEYFDNTDLQGTPVLTGTAPRIDFDLDRAAPDARLKTLHYSARWSGDFVPPAAGDYTLHINMKRCWDCKAHDQVRLFVDGKLAVEDDGSRPEPASFKLHANDGTPREIRLELAHSGDDAGIALEWEPPAEALLDEAVDAAKGSDAVIVFAGISPDLEGEALQIHLEGFAGGDRVSLDLPQAQKTLLMRLAALHKPMVIVLNSGSALAVDPGAYAANAMLTAWYPGEEGGRALANVLTGKTNPSGRLPVTVYRSAADLPPFDDYSMAHRTYRYFDGPVLFPFGYGMSYTQFQYGAVKLERPTVSAGDGVTATVTLRNAGTLPGSEVAELYLAPPKAEGAPRLALAGIQRVMLKAGESRMLTFTLSPGQLSTVDTAGHRAVRAGDYRIFIGGSQPDLASTGRNAVAHVTGTKVVD